MIDLEIGGGSYQAPQSWDEITLKQFVEICGIKIPDRLLELYKASADLNTSEEKERKAAEAKYDKVSKKITQRDMVQEFPAYYGKVIKAATNIPAEILDQTDATDRAAFFDVFLRYVVQSSFYWQPIQRDGSKMGIYKPPTIESFEIEGEEYFLPESLNVYGEQIPMAREKVVSFAEASKIELELHELNNEGANQLPMFLAIYCRPKITREETEVIDFMHTINVAGRKFNTPFRKHKTVKKVVHEIEPYDEEKIIRRTGIMKQVTMDKVWAVFFCINGLFRLYQNSIRGFTQGLVRLHKEHSTGKVDSTILDGGEKSTK